MIYKDEAEKQERIRQACISEGFDPDEPAMSLVERWEQEAEMFKEKPYWLRKKEAEST